MTHFTDVRLLRRMLRDARHRNHSALGTLLHWHYVRAGELFSIIPLMGLADHVVNGGFPFDLPALKPFLLAKTEFCRRRKRLRITPAFWTPASATNACGRLLASVEGFTVAQAADPGFIPGDAVIREFIGGSTIKIPHNE